MNLTNIGRRVAHLATTLLTLVIVVGALSITPTATTAAATTAATTAVTTAAASATAMSAAQVEDYETQTQYWVNRQRVKRGLPRLRLAGCAEVVAKEWSKHLAVSGEFYHRSMSDVLDRCDAMYAGETLGRGTMTPRGLVTLWMQSPPHREVLLSSKSRRIGVGATYDDTGRWVVAANFLRF